MVRLQLTTERLLVEKVNMKVHWKHGNLRMFGCCRICHLFCQIDLVFTDTPMLLLLVAFQQVCRAFV